MYTYRLKYNFLNKKKKRKRVSFNLDEFNIIEINPALLCVLYVSRFFYEIKY